MVHRYKWWTVYQCTFYLTTMYSVQCTLYTVYCTLYRVYILLCLHVRTSYGVHCTMYTVQSTIDIVNVHSISYIVYCSELITQYSIYYVYIVHCTLYIVHYSLYIIYCTLYTVHCKLYVVYSSMNVSWVLNEFYVVQCVLH